MDLNKLSKDELRKTMPAKTRIEYRPTPVVRLTDEQKLEQIARLRSIIGTKKVAKQADVDQEIGG